MSKFRNMIRIIHNFEARMKKRPSVSYGMIMKDEELPPPDFKQLHRATELRFKSSVVPQSHSARRIGFVD